MKSVISFFVFLVLWVMSCYIVDTYMADVVNAYVMAAGWLAGTMSIFIGNLVANIISGE